MKTFINMRAYLLFTFFLKSQEKALLVKKLLFKKL